MRAEQESRADEPTRLKIARRAYELWESKGCPNGCDIDHWLQAEAEIASAEPESVRAPKSAAQ